MPIDPPLLPYDSAALQPHLSAETVDLHHGQLQRAHVARVNALAANTPFAEASLAEIAKTAQGALAEHAAQAWSDDFYWRGMRPNASGAPREPDDALHAAIVKSFGDVAGLRRQFDALALRAFGSGWAWLLQREDGALAIAFTPNAATPLTGTATPLLACCLWEHAWLLDYRHERERYLAAFWQLVDWTAVAKRMR